MIDLPANAAAPTFDSPLEMLHDSHERIMDQCAALQKLIHHLRVHGCDEQAQLAAQAIMHYFDSDGMIHHQDEEQFLFPLLRAAQIADADDLIKHLLGEHRAMEASWVELRSQLQGIADGQSATLERNIIADFSLAYGRHIMLENTQLLPFSAQFLDRQQLHELGKKMAELRGIALLQS